MTTMGEGSTMNQTIRRATGEIIDAQTPDDLHLLDVYSPSPIADEAPRLDALATISAGYRHVGDDGKPGLPVVSRDGTIYLSDPRGRAPRLKEVLAARGNKALTIAFPFDNPAAFVQQRFTIYSASKLLAYGDEYQITVVDEKTGERKVLQADTDDYDDVRRRCKNSVSIYFALARWLEDGTPVVEFPDGLGLYRLRTTSRNTLRSLRASLQHVGAFTHGHIAGVPFDIALDYRDVAGPDGSRRNVPVWTFTMRPPETLSSRTFVPTLGAALREGRLLQLPPPGAEDYASAEVDFRLLGDDDGSVEEPSAEDLALLAEGGRCDARAWEAKWFALVRGTRLEGDEARADFIRSFSDGEYHSLAALLAEASESQANILFNAAVQVVETWRQEQRAAERAASGRVPLDLTALDDDYGYARPAVATVEGPFFDRPMEREDVLAEGEASDEEASPPAFTAHTAEQRAALEQLLGPRPRELAAVRWEALSFEDAATWIMSLQG
jgi:hypothetical protein